MPTVDNLNIQIISNSKTAVSGIDALTAALGRLKTTSKGGTGLQTVSKQIAQLGIAGKSVSGDSASKIQQLALALRLLSSTGNVKISSSISTQISKIGLAVASLSTTDFSAVGRLSAGLAPLATLGKSQLGSFISQLGKLPKLAQEIAAMDLTKFILQMEQLATAMTPLADKMNKISAGFAALPSKIKGVVSGLNATTAAAPKTGSAMSFLNSSISGVTMKFSIFYMIIRRVKDVLASFITNSMAYTENLNLFNVSMGDYAEAAMEYGRKVQSVMGIDLSEWVRNQGIFMQLTTGFGIADKSAASISKTMTQLSYDLASLFNSDVETSMQKVQSGLAGELEPLRRWGYDLSVAKLQEVALSLGIDQRVISMTQADKAQLRFIAIMQQSNNAVGDMARTLITPANAMRIMSQLVERLKRALGDMLIPILSAVMPYVMAFTTVLIDAANALATLMGFADIKIDYGNLGGGLGGVTDDIDGVTGSANSAAAAIKAFTLGFDQLNVIPSATSGSGGGDVGSASDWGIDYSTFEYDFLANADTKVAEIVASMKTALKPLSDAFGNLGTSLGPLMDQLKIFWEQYLVPFGLWVIGEGLPGLVDVIAGIFTWFNENPTATRDIAAFAAACLVLSKISSIAIGVKATLSGLGLLAPAVLGTGAATIPVTIAAAAIAVAATVTLIDWVTGTSFIDNAVKAWDLALGKYDGLGISLEGFFKSDDFATNFYAGLSKDSFLAGWAKSIGDWWAQNTSILKINATISPTTDTDAWDRTVNTFKLLGDMVGNSFLITLADGLRSAGINVNFDAAAKAWMDEWNANADKLKTDYVPLPAAPVPHTSADDGRTYQDYLYSLNSGVTDAMTLLTATVDLGTKEAARVMRENLGDGVGGGIRSVIDSFLHMPNAVNTEMNNMNSAVWGGSTTAHSLLTSNIGGGVDVSIGHLGRLSNNGSTRIETFADNVRIAMEAVLRNMSKLPTTAAGARGFAGLADGFLEKIHNLTMFATGGFPDRGQMFVAREAGPEMVGNIGSKTAVVNNSQIIQGITQGVAKGVAQAMGSASSGDGSPINIYFDNILGYTVSAAERKNARAGKVVVSLGGKS